MLVYSVNTLPQDPIFSILPASTLVLSVEECIYQFFLPLLPGGGEVAFPLVSHLTGTLLTYQGRNSEDVEEKVREGLMDLMDLRSKAGAIKFVVQDFIVERPLLDQYGDKRPHKLFAKFTAIAENSVRRLG